MEKVRTVDMILFVMMCIMLCLVLGHIAKDEFLITVAWVMGVCTGIISLAFFLWTWKNGQ